MMFPHSAFFCLKLRQLDEYLAGELLSFLHENSSHFKECTAGKYACLVSLLKPWPHHNTTKTAAAQLTNCQQLVRAVKQIHIILESFFPLQRVVSYTKKNLLISLETLKKNTI